MEPTIFALGIACSQVLMITLIIAKSIYSHHKIEVKVLTNVLTNGHVDKYKYAKLYFRIRCSQRVNSAKSRTRWRRGRRRMTAGRTR